MSEKLELIKAEIQAQGLILIDTNTAIIAEGEQVASQIQALKDQIAAGGSPTEAELGTVLESMQRVTAAAQAAKTAVEAIFTPEPAPEPIPEPDPVVEPPAEPTV